MLDTTSSLSPVAALSDEQLAIARYVDEGKGNILVVARAGTGKTFLIRKCLPLMVGNVAILAFNKKIASEIATKVAEDGSKADVGTFHAFGARALRRAFPAAKIEGKAGDARSAGYKKWDRIAKELEIPAHLMSFAEKAANLAMQRGFGVLCPLNDPQAWLDLVAHFDLEDEIAEDNIACQMKGRDAVIKMGLQFAAKAVKKSVQLAHEVYSFSDMLYLPLVLNLRLPTFDWVCIDEAQDSNALRREMARRMVCLGGRTFWVGDDFQAIYGFTGADNDALEQIGREFACTRFPMTVTFRCAKAVVDLARTLVPDYRAADTNPEGIARSISEDEFADEVLVPGQDAIICRRTAPLISLAYALISRGIPSHVEGREIGKGLLTLVDRWSVKTITALSDKLNSYRTKETAKLLADKKEMQADALGDKVDALFVLIGSLSKGATVADLRVKINALFEDTPDGQRAKTVTLLTAHRSKGLEYSRVYGLGVAKFMPSKYAKQDWQLAQELHLEYVLYTRAIREYVDVVVTE